MGLRASLLGMAFAAASVAAQGLAPAATAAPEHRADAAKPAEYVIAPGTKVPLSLINSVSTKHSAEGDRVYLETVFPIMANGRVVIPPGSYVAGTVTQIKRPGRVKGRGELFLRFDSLTLPNGITRDFRARLGNGDAAANEEVDRAEGKIKSEGNKSGDAATIGEAAGAGASVGAIAGSVAGHAAMGVGIGAAAGAAAGLMGVLLTRGPDAVLAKGSTIEMVLDRALSFEDTELNFGPLQPLPVSSAAPPAKKNSGILPARRFPF